MARESSECDVKHLFDAVISCLNYIATNPFRGAMAWNNSLNKIAARYSPQALEGLGKCLLVSNRRQSEFSLNSA